MEVVKLKKKKHLIVLEVDGSLPEDVFKSITERITDAGDFKVLFTQSNTTVTVLDLED